MRKPAWAHLENVTFEDSERPTPVEAKAALRRDVNEIMIAEGIGYSDLMGRSSKHSEVKERIALIAHTRLIEWVAECEMGLFVGIRRTCFVYALKRARAKLKC
tara:strand:- start:1 stop:309 length:309 start_codon:yes stop_codon:yes gene_type:complete